LGAPDVEGAGTVSGGFDVGAAGGLAASARGAAGEVTGAVPATEEPALGSEAAAVVVAGEGVDGEGVPVVGSVVAAEALPAGGVVAATEVVGGVARASVVSPRPATSGHRK
jgi:hypothetical protein